MILKIALLYALDGSQIEIYVKPQHTPLVVFQVGGVQDYLWNTHDASVEIVTKDSASVLRDS